VDGDSEARHDRLLPWIAAERSIRALLLFAVGIVLLSHPHANWAKETSSLVRHLGLDPNDNWIQRLLHDLAKLHAKDNVLFGTIALAYGALEAAEAVGLWRRERWGELLTILATSLLLIPEAWELTKSVSALKLGGLIVNLLVVAYLIWRLRGQPPSTGPSDRGGASPPTR
jgi:uncharacterized membrane protein (DUF2068 family)